MASQRRYCSRVGHRKTYGQSSRRQRCRILVGTEIRILGGTEMQTPFLGRQIRRSGLCRKDGRILVGSEIRILGGTEMQTFTFGQ